MQAADSSGNDSEAESSEDEFDHASIHSMGRGRKVKVGGLLAHANVLCLWSNPIYYQSIVCFPISLLDHHFTMFDCYAANSTGIVLSLESKNSACKE